MQSDIDKAIKQLGALGKQVPFAAAKTLTQTAKKIEQIEKLEMKRVFKKPTRYTLNAQYVKAATKRNLEATVWLRGSNRKRDRHYLEPHVYGGGREHTGFENRLIARGIMPKGMYAIPGKHMGRITRGKYQKILAQLKAYNDPYQNATNSTRSKRNRRAMAFFVNLKARPQGIWMRQGKKVIPAFIFVKGSLRYKKRFNFHEIANKVSTKYWPGAFSKNISHAIRTAR